jgi:hypothetical protein
MACVLLMNKDITGTANKGKPTPNVPLITPPHRMAVAQIAMTIRRSLLSSKPMGW